MLSEYDLRTRQSMPLSVKVRMAEARIREWYEHYEGQVCVSDSGGKDSMVLRHLVRNLYPEVPSVHCDTGVEYPEIREAIRLVDNVTIVRPRIPFRDVLAKYGYPIPSKRIAQYIHEAQGKGEATKRLRLVGIDSRGVFHPMSKIPAKWLFLLSAPFPISDRCCDVLKKHPLNAYMKELGRFPFVGTMAADSGQRAQTYRKLGCNAYDTGRPRSTPLGPWTEQDVLEYTKAHGLPLAKVYGEIVDAGGGRLQCTGASRTGCIYCGFGCHLEKPINRFQRLALTYPKLWAYAMDTLGYRKVLTYIGVPFEAKATHEPKGQWMLEL